MLQWGKTMLLWGKILYYGKKLWFYTENYGTSIYEGEEHTWLPKIIKLWFIIEK